MKYSLLIVILLAFLIVFGTLGSMNGWFNQVLPETTITVSTKTYKEQNPKYTIDIEYPFFSGFRKSATEKTANEKMNAFVMDQVQIFTSEPGTTTTDVLSGASDLTTRYMTHAATGDLISVAFDNSFYSEGAAHPGNYTLTFNYLPKTGAFLSLADLFKDNYIPTLSAAAQKHLREILKNKNITEDAAWIDKGAGPLEENFKTFAVRHDAIILYFDPYQVAPYAAGTFMVVIPFSEIEEVVRADLPFVRTQTEE